MNITADGIAATMSLVDITMKRQEIRHLLDRLAYSEDHEQRQTIQRQLERLIEDVRMSTRLRER